MMALGIKKELPDLSNSSREATAGFEPAIRVLQTPALPLGYVAEVCGNAANRIKMAGDCQILPQYRRYQVIDIKIVELKFLR